MTHTQHINGYYSTHTCAVFEHQLHHTSSLTVQMLFGKKTFLFERKWKNWFFRAYRTQKSAPVHDLKSAQVNYCTWFPFTLSFARLSPAQCLRKPLSVIVKRREGMRLHHEEECLVLRLDTGSSLPSKLNKLRPCLEKLQKHSTALLISSLSQMCKRVCSIYRMQS